MELKEILAALDDEISRLKLVRSLLAGADGHVTQSATNQTAPRKRRRMSAKARARIGAAQKKRWAAQKKAAK